MIIYEYQVYLQSHTTYVVLEGDNLNEADRQLQLRYQFLGRFFKIHRAFGPKQFEQLEEMTQEIQSNLEILLQQNDLDMFHTEVEKFSKTHAILFDEEKKLIRVYPTLDPTFKYERKYYVLTQKQQSDTVRDEKLA